MLIAAISFLVINFGCTRHSRALSCYVLNFIACSCCCSWRWYYPLLAPLIQPASHVWDLRLPPAKLHSTAKWQNVTLSFILWSLLPTFVSWWLKATASGRLKKIWIYSYKYLCEGKWQSLFCTSIFYLLQMPETLCNPYFFWLCNPSVYRGGSRRSCFY